MNFHYLHLLLLSICCQSLASHNLNITQRQLINEATEDYDLIYLNTTEFDLPATTELPKNFVYDWFSNVNNFGKVYKARIVSVIVLGDTFPFQYRFDFRLIKPAIELAVERARRLYPHIHFDLVHRTGYKSCKSTSAGAYAAEEYLDRGTDFYIGPGCNRALSLVSSLASHWNIPICTAGGVGTEFEDKNVHSTLLRLSVTIRSITDKIISVLKYFDWHHVAVLVDSKHWTSIYIKEDLEDAFPLAYPYLFKAKFYEFNFAKKPNFTALLQEASLSARVFVLLSNGDTVREMLIAASKLNMDNGEYAFLTIELFKSKRVFGDFTWLKETGPKNESLWKIYQSVLMLSIRVPKSVAYSRFKSFIVRRTKEEFNITVERSSIAVSVAGFHDCVLMYAYALNKTLTEKSDPKDGRMLIRRLWNASYHEGMVGDIIIDSKGDREADFTLNDLDELEGDMKPVAIHYGGQSMGFIPLENTNINWPYSQPIDIPRCGFDGSYVICKPKEIVKYTHTLITPIAIVSTLLFLITAIGGFFLYRKYKLESELSNLWWKVNWNEILFSDASFSSVTQRSGNNSGSHSPNDIPLTALSFQLANNNELKALSKSFALRTDHRITSIKTRLRMGNSSDDYGTRLGHYNNVKVVVKVMNIPKLTMTREILMELKLIRDLVHDNLVRLIGLCPEAPNIALITELCTRGSLQDLLQNDNIRLDWTFRYSIMNDIVNGMQFIHSSPIEYHGRLKSSNCVIDNRFAVKLSDFGLSTLLSYVEEEEINYHTLLWTAPEHLRVKNPLLQGSQKGDVYSFSIICQEIVTRCGPFESEPECTTRLVVNAEQYKLEPQDILNLVRLGTTPPLRPYLPACNESNRGENIASNELRVLIQKGWEEMPSERPTFNAIKEQMKRINRRDFGSANLLDNLLKRMEHYADNLEELVDDRTAALMDEKKRSDELLYQLMPKFVVTQLKAGHHVEPEAFECVTICFTDIVGFTKISARSTPIEVVDLLNDLYTCFDSIINNYDVYKVETIGDAYMVVSGIPVRNPLHCREIAHMSLNLLSEISNFKMKHLPNETLRLRAGFHSGPCAAGVIGSKMPRYCLFGDTVNTASRMESYSQAMKIHISKESKDILEPLNLFDIECRGEIDVKGKGILTTFWLNGFKGH